MNERSFRKRPPTFYLNVLIALDALLIALVVLSGGINLEIGPLHLRIMQLRGPALALLLLLIARRAIGAGMKKKDAPPAPPWQERVFGKAGSVKEQYRATEVLFLLMAVFTFFVGGAALARHRHFGSEAISLGTAAQVAWNMVQGRYFLSSLAGDGSWLGMSFSPIMVMVAQVYRFWPAPETLVKLQTLFLALGAWPVYVIARDKLGDRRWGLGLAVLYLVHPAVRGAALAGFDPATLAVLPLLLAWYLLDEKRRWGGYVFLCLALACGQEVWLAAAGMGLYLCLVRRRWREGLFLFLLTFYGFVFLTSYLMPKLGGEEGMYLGLFSHLGDSGMEILGTVVFHPGRVVELLLDPARLGYLRDLFVPLVFLPLLGPLQLAVAVPLLTGNLLAGDPARYSSGSSHAALLIPFIFAAAAVGLRRARDGRYLQRLNLFKGPLLRWAMLILPLLALGTSPAAHFKAGAPEGYEGRFAEAAALIPAGASLSAQGHLVPHLAHREGLHRFPEVAGAECVLVELGRMKGGEGEGDESRAALLRLVKEEKYAVLHWDETFLLLALTAGDRSPETLKSLSDSL